jgi:membrane-associated protease RseP (regulator of RpoE activity)
MTHVEEFTKGWETCLENLKSVLETGLDKRVYERPMLGIVVSQILTAEDAQELGLPVEYGISLADTLEGMGAQAAGLQGGDVLVSIDGTELKTIQDFNSALSDRKAGDQIEVVFYRGNEEHSTQMTLSGRPIPEVPDSAKALSERIAKIYEQTNDELESLLDGVNEEEASFRPEQEEWSAKEVLAHLIFNERWLHLAITAAIGNYRPGGFTNDLGMHAAIANTYTLEELTAEFKNCETITVKAVAALPEDFVADKRRFVPLATLLGEQGFILHTRAHLPQMRAAIEAARD